MYDQVKLVFSEASLWQQKHTIAIATATGEGLCLSSLLDSMEVFSQNHHTDHLITIELMR